MVGGGLGSSSAPACFPLEATLLFSEHFSSVSHVPECALGGFLWRPPHAPILLALAVASVESTVWKTSPRWETPVFWTTEAFCRRLTSVPPLQKRRDEMASEGLSLFRHTSCQFSEPHYSRWRWTELTGLHRDSSLSVSLRLSCSFFVTSKVSHSSHTKTCEKTLRF